MGPADFKDFESTPRPSKEEYERRASELRVELVNAQFDLQHSDRTVLILVAGDDREGTHELIDLLHEWLDARRLRTEVFLEKTDEEQRHPAFWRYWRALPRRGQIGILLGAWSYEAIEGRLYGTSSEEDFERLSRHACNFERTLAVDGATVVKFWIHTPRKVLEKRQRKSAKSRYGRRSAERNQRFLDFHEKLVQLGEQYVARTEAPHAPWTVVSGKDPRGRDLLAAETLLRALQAGAGAAPTPTPMPTPEPADGAPTLAELDLGAELPSKPYEKRLAAAQERLSDLTIEASERGLSSVLVFEGPDAAGKGGAIRRMTRAMAAPVYGVVPIGAPSDEEQRHHYLWRFWKQLGRAGRMTIFDRSWYGRVLVERVEGFATEAQWRRAYAEIVEFEELLVESGAPLLKFWLHIDREEQLRRFEAREKTPYKKYKIGREDYRNRARWDDYVEAADEMFARTHRPHAPWHVVAAQDKRHARVVVIETVCAALAAKLAAD